MLALILLASAPSWQLVAPPPLVTRARPAARLASHPRLQLGDDDAPSDVDDDAVASAPEVITEPTESEAAKAALLDALAPLDRGFSATSSQREEVDRLIQKLIELKPASEARGLGGDWELCYSDAPDIIGLNGGPLARLTRIG